MQNQHRKKHIFVLFFLICVVSIVSVFAVFQQQDGKVTYTQKEEIFTMPRSLMSDDGKSLNTLDVETPATLALLPLQEALENEPVETVSPDNSEEISEDKVVETGLTDSSLPVNTEVASLSPQISETITKQSDSSFTETVQEENVPVTESTSELMTAVEPEKSVDLSASLEPVVPSSTEAIEASSVASSLPEITDEPSPLASTEISEVASVEVPSITETTSADSISDQAISDVAISDEAISDEAISDEAISDEAISDDSFADDAFGDDAFGDLNFDSFGPTGTPLPPEMFEPAVLDQEQYDTFNKAPATSTEDDSFFDDFYIAGQDSTPLVDDGTYYMALAINDIRVGDVEVKIADSVSSISKASLLSRIQGKITDESFARIENYNLDYLTIDDFTKLGVETKIDVIGFIVTMEFSAADMPLQVVSITQKADSYTRDDSFGIYNAIVLEPEPFSDSISTYLSTYRSFGEDESIFRDYPWTVNLNMSHAIGVKGIAFDLSNQLSYTIYNDSDDSPFSSTIGSWTGYFDIEDKNLRFTFGQTGSYLSYTGTPIGFSIDKSYSYGNDEALESQIVKHFILKYDSIVTITINGKQVYSAQKRKGEYKFTNLPLANGINYVNFIFEPIDETKKAETKEYVIPYDTRLLAKGDYTYGFSAAIDKTEITDDTDDPSYLRLPYLDGTWYEYHPEDFQARFYMNVGLSHYFTLNTSFAAEEDVMQVSFTEVLATMQGSFSGTTSVKFVDGFTPTVSQSLSHTFETWIGPISTSVSYYMPVYNLPDFDEYTETIGYLSLGYSFNILFLPISTSTTYGYSDSVQYWTEAMSTSYAPTSGVSFTASLSLSGSSPDFYSPTSSFSLGASIAIGAHASSSVSYSSSGSVSTSLSYSPSDDDSLTTSLSGIMLDGFVFDEENTDYVLSTSFSHKGDLYSLSASDYLSDDFTSHSLSLSLSSSFLVAGTHFAISKSSTNNFLLINPTGRLKGNPVSVGKTNTADPTELDSLFNKYVYTSITEGVKNNVIIYGSTGSMLSNNSTFAYEIEPGLRESYYVTLKLPLTFSATGFIYNSDGTPLKQYSAPVYHIEVDADGTRQAVKDSEAYLFTDFNGRYILSDLDPGEYMFDLRGDDGWYVVTFTVDDDDKKNVVEEFEPVTIPQAQDGIDVIDEDAIFGVGDFIDSGENSITVFDDVEVTGYTAAIAIEKTKNISEDEFWDVIFPDSQQDETVDPFADTSDISGESVNYLSLNDF